MGRTCDYHRTGSAEECVADVSRGQDTDMGRRPRGQVCAPSRAAPFADRRADCRGVSLLALSDLNVSQLKHIRSWPALGIVSQKKAEELEKLAHDRMSYGSPAVQVAPARSVNVVDVDSGGPRKVALPQYKQPLNRSAFGQVVTADC